MAMYFPAEEYEARWSATYRAMAERGYETSVIWQRTGGGFDRAGDVWYLSNYASMNIGQEQSSFGIGCAFAALLLHRGAEPELHILGPETSDLESVDMRYVAVQHLVRHDGNVAMGLAEHLNRLGVEGKVAYVGDNFLPAQMYRPLAASTPSIEWVAEDDLLYEVQSHASPRELDLYREYAAVSSRALTALIHALIGGQTQARAAARAAEIIVASGGGYQRIGCHTGAAGEVHLFDYPLYGYSRDAFAAPGEMVRGWLIPVFEGYWWDIGRTAICGNSPNAAQRSLLESSAAITERVAAEIRPGRTPREVGAIIDRYVEASGFPGDESAGIYGHGMSTFFSGPIIPAARAEVEDEDSLWALDEPFRDGQIFTSESLRSAPGVGQAGFEQQFIIQEGGNELLISTPLLFW